MGHNIVSDGYFNQATNGSNKKIRRHNMTKDASTSNCVEKDGGGSCGRVPLPLPCLPSSPCKLSLPLLLPLLPSSPRHCPCTAAATNDDSSKHGAPPQPLLPSLLPSTWGGSGRVGAHRCCPLWPIAAASPRRTGIILGWRQQFFPPILVSPSPPPMTGSVAIDIYS
jgi:hypothetical protein